MRVIHGHGTGQLRRALGAFLASIRSSRAVARAAGQGGGGVTVVELKD